MIQITVREAQADLPKYLAEVASGNIVIVVDHNLPVAEIRRASQSSRQPRPIGLAKGTFEVPSSFFDPLPAEILEAFNGGGK